MAETRNETALAKLFGKNLRYLLGIHNETLLTFSKSIEVFTSTSSLWCNGRRFPSPENIEKICAHFNIDPRCLFDPKGIATDVESASTSAFRFSIPVMMDGEHGVSVMTVSEMQIEGRKQMSDLAIRLSDSGMEPTYPVGSMILYRSGATVDDISKTTHLAVVSISNHRTLRRVYKTGDTYVVTADNPSVEPLFFTKELLDDVLEGVPVICQLSM